MAAFLDFGAGALITHLVRRLMGAEINLFVLFVGGVLAFLPDFDSLVPVLAGKGAEEHHQSPFHRPLLMVPVTTALVWVLWGEVWGVTTCACLLYHFLHDTPPFGGGYLNWFWPWGIEKPSGPQGPWLERYWWRPSRLSFTELSLGSLALYLALSLSGFQPWAIGAVALAWAGSIFVWIAALFVRR